MEEIPTPGKHGTHGNRKKSRRSPENDNGDLIECSGEYCRSCAAGFMADCVAVSCCPCAVVNLLALALVKLPWVVGRRCLGLGKTRQKLRRKRMCEKREESEHVIERNGSLRRGSINDKALTMEYFGELEVEEQAERMLFEFYQVGHLGFGRVSFSGIQFPGKGNHEKENHL